MNFCYILLGDALITGWSKLFIFKFSDVRVPLLIILVIFEIAANPVRKICANGAEGGGSERHT